MKNAKLLKLIDDRMELLEERAKSAKFHEEIEEVRRSNTRISELEYLKRKINSIIGAK